jgi:tetratricopeptide (TPR) repeat protein
MSQPKRKPPARPATKTEPPAEPPKGSSANRRVWLLLPALLAAALLAYYPVWHGGMLWDDNAHITPPALRSAGGLWRIWFDVGATQQYYPAVHTALWLMCRLWGEHTLGYHLANIILHASSAFLLALILRRLSVPGACFAATIFALHPVFVESVAWITELKNTLSGAFCLGAALAYLHFDGNRKRRFYVMALGLFLLALMSKSVTATMPAALLVVFWWQRGALRMRRDFVPLIPFLVCGISAGLFTSWVERTIIGAEGEAFGFSLIERCLIAGRAVWFYLSKLSWPADLIFLYPRWQIDAGAWWQYLYPISLAILLAALWRLRRFSRAPLAAMLAFCGMLFPALGFFNVYPFVFSFVADHFQYLASITIIAVFSAAATRIVRRCKVRFVPAAAALAVGGLLGLLTWNQSRHYVNAETLYRFTLGRNPTSWLAHNNLGSLLLGGSKTEVREGIFHIQEALKLKPDYAGAWMNLGTAFRTLGRFQEALAPYEKAIAFNRNIPEAHANLGLTLYALGRREAALARYREAIRLKSDFAEPHVFLGEALREAGSPEDAIVEIQEALRLNPGYPQAYKALANTSIRLGRIEDAIAQYGKALSLKPDYVEARTNLGVAYQLAGRLQEAVAQHQEALRLRPDFADAQVNLGNALLALGRTEDAAAQYRKAIRLNPTRAEAYQWLGSALQKLGKPEEALQQFAQAVRYNPSSADARDALAAALLQQGQIAEALAQLGEALRLKPDHASAHYNLGNALQGMGRPQEAIAHYQAALRTKPEVADIHNALGAALAATGRLDEAVPHFQEALRLYPDYPAARSNLARALALGGRPGQSPSSATGRKK